MRPHAQRLTGVESTIFAEMSALAVRTGSVNLGQGFPDEDGPPEVIEAAVAALRGGRNQYPPGLGIPELRDAIARHQARWYGLMLDPDTEIVVTTGATEAIAGAILGLVDPGDEVVVLEPYYDSYVAVIQMAGGVRRPVTLRAGGTARGQAGLRPRGTGFRVPIDELRAAVTSRTTANRDSFRGLRPRFEGAARCANFGRCQMISSPRRCVAGTSWVSADSSSALSSAARSWVCSSTTSPAPRRSASSRASRSACCSARSASSRACDVRCATEVTR